MNRHILRCVYAIALMFAACFPMSANAKGLLIFNTGDEIFSVDKLPANLAEEYPDGSELGYYCKRFGILWADVWTWECKLSVVSLEKESYADLPASDLAALENQYSMSDAKRGIWNKYGLLIIALLFVGYFLWDNRRSNKKTPTSEETLQ